MSNKEKRTAVIHKTTTTVLADSLRSMRCSSRGTALNNYLLCKVKARQLRREILKHRSSGTEVSKLERRLEILEHSMDKYIDMIEYLSNGVETSQE